MLFCAVAAALAATSCSPEEAPATTTQIITVEGHDISVAAPAGATLDVIAADLADLPILPGNADLPLGALDITVGGVASGSVVELTITLDTPVDDVVKLIDGVWDDFEHDGLTGATLSPDGTTIIVRLQDGGRGDADGIANGIIVDPIAPINNTEPAQTGVTIQQRLVIVPADAGIVDSQFIATNATGNVTWTLERGTLPEGLTFTAAGRLSGTIAEPIGRGFPIVVRATDAASTSTSYSGLMHAPPDVLPVGGAVPPATGESLPDGTSLLIRTQNESGTYGGSAIRADGAVSPIMMSGWDRFAAQAFFSPLGTSIVRDPGLTANGHAFVDATTGALVASIAAPAGLEPGRFAGSPDRTRLAVEFPSEGSQTSTLQVYDTSNGSLIATTDIPWPARIFWSPDSTTLAAPAYTASGQTITLLNRDGVVIREFTPSASDDACEARAWLSNISLYAVCRSDVRSVPIDGSPAQTIIADSVVGQPHLTGSACSPTQRAIYRDGPAVLTPGSSPGLSPDRRFLALVESCFTVPTPIGATSRVVYLDTWNPGVVVGLTELRPNAGEGALGISVIAWV